MATTHTIHSATLLESENHILHTTQTTLKFAYGLVPIAAGADKFTNVLAQWEQYLNPLALQIIPVSATTFMYFVGIVEIAAGILVFLKPRLGAFVVMAWLLAIAAQLLVGWMFVDIAVRDITMALGALTLARLTPIVHAHEENSAHP